MSKRKAGPGDGMAKKARSDSSDRYIDIIEGIYELKDGTHEIVELFRELPSAELYPDYRDLVEVPISMAEISKRAKLGAYDTDDDLIGDVEQMVENARIYNGSDSPVVDDATFILDFVLAQLGRQFSPSTRQSQQLKVVTDLQNYKVRGRRLGDAFVVEPSREEYPSYYEVVKNPTSFTTVLSKLESEPEPDWPSFVALVSPIFNNAILYNMEGSEIYNDAKTLLRQLQNRVSKFEQMYNARAMPTRKRQSNTLKLKLRVGGGSPETSGRGRRTSRAAIADHDDDSDDYEHDDLGDDNDSDGYEDVVEHRYDDDDDEDFEADPDDLDDEDLGEEEDDEIDNDDLVERQRAMQQAQAQQQQQNLPPPPPPTVVCNELVHRPKGSGPRDALIQLTTLTSLLPMPPGAPGGLGPNGAQHSRTVLPRASSDMVQIRVPASRTRTFTSMTATLASWHHALQLSIYVDEKLRQRAHNLTVLLNGRRLMPLPAQGPPMMALPAEFDVRLAPGLNQVTVSAIVGDEHGMVRPFGPPPVEGMLPDEERLVLWLNLLR